MFDAWADMRRKDIAQKDAERHVTTVTQKTTKASNVLLPLIGNQRKDKSIILRPGVIEELCVDGIDA